MAPYKFTLDGRELPYPLSERQLAQMEGRFSIDPGMVDELMRLAASGDREKFATLLGSYQLECIRSGREGLIRRMRAVLSVYPYEGLYAPGLSEPKD